jgi:hypothetical protein
LPVKKIILIVAFFFRYNLWLGLFIGSSVHIYRIVHWGALPAVPLFNGGGGSVISRSSSVSFL